MKPGAALAESLASLGYSSDCDKCRMRKEIMDARGITWCRNNIDIIVKWISQSAARQGWIEKIIFNNIVGRAAIKLYILDVFDRLESEDG